MEKNYLTCYIALRCQVNLFCLNWRQICNGIVDCGRGEDERADLCFQIESNPCHSENEFRCQDGRCIPMTMRLNSISACLDLSQMQLFSVDLYQLNTMLIRFFIQIWSPVWMHVRIIIIWNISLNYSLRMMKVTDLCNCFWSARRQSISNNPVGKNSILSRIRLFIHWFIFYMIKINLGWICSTIQVQISSVIEKNFVQIILLISSHSRRIISLVS